MYQELPEDIKEYLTQAGLNIQVIKRSTVQEEKFELERYEKNAIIEIGKAA